MTNRILCHEHATLLKLNFFQLIEQRHSWDSVLVLIYWIDAHDLTRKIRMQERWKNALRLRMDVTS